jgi:Domain of unknown function (DUF222)
MPGRPLTVYDAMTAPAETARSLAAAVPQPSLVEPLAALRFTELDADSTLAALVAVYRHIAMLQAFAAELLDRLTADPGPAEPVGADVQRVAAALHWSRRTAARRIAEAQTLVSRLPGTFAALREGRISSTHAVAVCSAVRHVPGDRTGAFESAVLAGSGLTVGQFRAVLARARRVFSGG